MLLLHLNQQNQLKNFKFYVKLRKVFCIFFSIFVLSTFHAQYFYLPSTTQGNPGGLNNDNEYPNGSGLDASWTSLLPGGNSSPTWSPIDTIPFNFNFKANFMLLAKYTIEKLEILSQSEKSWRPNILVFSGVPSKRWHLIEVASAITNDKGFLTIAYVVNPSSSKHHDHTMGVNSVADFISKNHKKEFFINIACMHQFSKIPIIHSKYGLTTWNCSKWVEI